jgi:alcohol dehydrogenase class IV
MRYNIGGCEEKFGRIASTMRLPGRDGEAVVERLFGFNQEVGLPVRLRDIGVRGEHIETLADLAFADFAHPNNPKPVSREDFKNLYLEAL